MPRTQNLTPRQKEVYDDVQAYMKKHNCTQSTAIKKLGVSVGTYHEAKRNMGIPPRRKPSAKKTAAPKVIDVEVPAAQAESKIAVIVCPIDSIKDVVRNLT